MSKSDTVSVRIGPDTRRILAESAADRDLPGISALAREILEDWAAARSLERRSAGIDRAVSYLREHPDWGDEPEDFFPGAAAKP